MSGLDGCKPWQATICPFCNPFKSLTFSVKKMTWPSLNPLTLIFLLKYPKRYEGAKAMTRSNAKIHLASDLKTYFESEVSSIAKKQGTDMSPFASNYLARLLERFSKMNNYAVDAKPSASTDEPNKKNLPILANLWLESLHLNPSEQFLMLQQLGDISLFTSGFFGDRIRHSVVDMDYYIAMGGRAYERVGHLRETIAAEKALNVFFELSSGFESFVEVFAEISDSSLLGDEKSLLRLYEKWIENRSDRIARMLAEKGIIAAPKAED